MCSWEVLCSSSIWGEGINLLDVELGEAQGDIGIAEAIFVQAAMSVRVSSIISV